MGRWDWDRIDFRTSFLMDPQIDFELNVDVDTNFASDDDDFDECELDGRCREQMKCEFPQGDNVCKRCKAGGHACIVEGRKPRSAPKSVSSLLFFPAFPFPLFYYTVLPRPSSASL